MHQCFTQHLEQPPRRAQRAPRELERLDTRDQVEDDLLNLYFTGNSSVALNALGIFERVEAGEIDLCDSGNGRLRDPAPVDRLSPHPIRGVPLDVLRQDLLPPR